MSALSPDLVRQFPGEAASLLPLLEDESITDIFVNGLDSLFIESSGRMVSIPNPFTSLESLRRFIERLLLPLSRQIDAAHPYLDGKLLDGSRFHLILSPLAHPGPCLSIRKFKSAGALPLEAFGGFSAVQLKNWVRQKKNLLISGSTGSGKTTLLTRLLDEVDSAERLILVEEAREVRSLHPHLVGLEARPPNPDGHGEVTLRQLLRNALRMRPDRIVVGECRGPEAFEMVQAMSTGHAGSLGTLHASSALGALYRLETLVFLSGLPLSQMAVREWISGAVDYVIQLERRAERRVIVEVLRIQGLEGERYRHSPQTA